MKNLRDKILDSSCPVILYELLPPSIHYSVNVDAYTQCAIDLITSSSVAIDAINVPEIREEYNSKENHRPKMDIRSFANALEGSMYKHIEVVLNHCTVYEPLEQQLNWLNTSTQDHNLQFLILVGGNSSKITYPGPSVVEMSRHIQNHFEEKLFCGGITIQSRRFHDQEKDEPSRLIIKGNEGMHFFTTQIIYDPVCVKFLLRDYAQACEQARIKPKRIFLSFAPISNVKDLGFLRWLGVFIPQTIENELFKADIGVGWRSTKIEENILQEILSFMQHEKIKIPLGLNIEHISRHNFELSLILIQRLGNLYKNYQSLLTQAQSPN
jgi:hypothetical protein